VTRPPNPLLADRAWLHRRYVEEAVPVSEIAAEAGVDPSTVHLWLQRHEIPRRHAHELDDARLRRLLARHPMKEVARRLGVDTATIYDRLYRAQERHVELLASPAQLRAWYVRYGWPLARVAAKLGVSRRTATRQLLAAGVEIRGPGRPRSGGPQ
jgi:transposase-like protein